MKTPRSTLFLASTAVLGLAIGMTGCLHLPGFARNLKVTPVPVTLPRIDPQAPENRLYAHAVRAIDRRDYGEALDTLQIANDARPGDPRVLTALGVIYDKLGRFDLSTRYYDLAEKADPGSKIVAIDRQYSLVLQGRSDSVQALATQTAAAPPTMAAPPARPEVVALIQPSDLSQVAAPVRLALLSSAPGTPIRYFNATGKPDGVVPVRARLASVGWTVAGLWSTDPRVRPYTQVIYPEDSARLASRLARTLPFRVHLQACQTCAHVELTVGANALAQATPARLTARMTTDRNPVVKRG